MNRFELYLINIFYLMILQFLFTSCSIIGAAIGGGIIDPPKQIGSFTQDQLHQINNGNKVIIYKTNHHSVRGTYLGIKQLSQQDYSENYNQFMMRNSELQLPHLSDTVSVKNEQLLSSRFINTKFNGFDKDCFYVQGIELYAFSKVPFNSNPIMLLQSGDTVEFQSINTLILENKVPYLSAVSLKIANNQKIKIPLNEILKVEMNNKGKGKGALTGFLVGLGIDVIIIIVLFATGAFNPGLG